MSWVRVMMMSQISVECLQSDHVLRSRQSSCSEASALCCMVGVVVIVVGVDAPVLQEKRECRQVKGPTVKHGEVRQQLMLRRLGSRALISAAGE